MIEQNETITPALLVDELQINLEKNSEYNDKRHASVSIFSDLHIYLLKFTPLPPLLHSMP